MLLAPGDEFAGYGIEAVLGTGGMGAVYLAKHPRLPRRDALKLLNPAFSHDPDFRARFEREADLAAGLIHRNIVAVYDRGAVDAQLWISMQYVAGTDASVAAHAGDGAMTPERVVHILAEVGAGLDFAHRAGLLHRDVKPANILLAAPDDPTEPEHVLLTDFGIAKSTDEVQHLTGTGNLLATLAYASPEQIEARPLDHRVDIYALGCVLYELLTGSVPFPQPTPFATMTAHLNQPPPKPSEAVPWLPRGFDAVVAKAMAKNPADRYSSCRELALAARAALAASNPAASSPTRAELAPLAVTGSAAESSGRGPGARSDGEAVVASLGLTKPRPPYTITVRRTSKADGGVEELDPVSTAALPTAERLAVEDLIERARFFDLPGRLPLDYVVPGDVLHTITVENDRLSRTVEYEREGSRHPVQLDEIVALLGQLSTWHRRAPVHPAYVGFSPTGSVPPLGGQAYRPTEAVPPQNLPGTGRPSGSHPLGGGPSGPNTTYGGGFGPPPSGFPGGTGPHSAQQGPVGTGPHSAPLGLIGTGPHQAGVGSTPPRSGRKKMWIVAAAAVVVVALAVTVFLVTRPPALQPPAAPTNVAAAVDESGKSITVRWSASAGATGYTLTRNGKVQYQGASTRYTDTKLPAGQYNYSVTANNDAGTSAPGTVVTAEIPEGPWGDAQFVADEFADLLPTTPTDRGYEGATCSITSDTYDSGADAIIGCSDSSNIYFEVMHFPSPEVWQEYLARDYPKAIKEVWTRDDEDQGDLYRSPDEEAVLPYIYTSFYEEDRSSYLVYVHWTEHTTPDLMKEWWESAPF